MAGPLGFLASLPRAVAAFEAEWIWRFREHLDNPRFWAVQAMVAAVTVGHAVGEIFDNGSLGPVYFLPATLYLFPVLYASLNFGREGAIPTALWSALLAVPNVVLWHQGLERLGETFQVSTMVLVAVIVATRVDKETGARSRAEHSERARAVSEFRYRALFDGAGEPILVLDAEGSVLDANAAAASVLSRSLDQLRSASIVDLLGSKAQDIVSAGGEAPVVASDISIRRPDGTEAWLQPVCTPVPTTDGTVVTQVLLRDITERRGFQHYAREIVRAQEEERQRIAQELHDVSLQSAVLICRRLDAVAEASERGEALTALLADARRAAEEMGNELRRFSRDLRPLILEDLGLVPALKRLTLELGDRSPVKCRLTVAGTPHRLDPASELTLFRIAQEALRNVERHANASSALVRLSYRADATTLAVTDDGIGIELPALISLASAGRLGIFGMQERARLVGGHCTIRSSPGKGMRVEAWVPGTP